MKKLLYIFAFAATIVACDKDGGLEMEETIALEEIQEIDAIIKNEASAIDFDVDGLIERLTSASSKANKKPGLEASKTNPVGSYIKVSKITTADTIYEFAWANGFHDDFECLPSEYSFVTFYLVLVEGNNTVISLSSDGSNPLSTIESDISFLYAFDLVLATKFTSGGDIFDGTIDGSVVTFGN